MNKPKIIFFDVDGTLVPLKGAARPRTLEALRRLHQNGIRLCIATGRAPMEVPKFEGVSFDAFLTYNGSEPDLEEYFAIGGVELKIAEDFEEMAKGEIFQVLMGGREEEYPAILKDVPHAKIAAWWNRAVDIIPASGGKGIAVEKVLEFYGISKADSMAFGDGNNDLEMFGAVGTGVAMGNASEKLKAAAAAHCRTVMEDGIYWYCLEQGLITT